MESLGLTDGDLDDLVDQAIQSPPQRSTGGGTERPASQPLSGGFGNANRNPSPGGPAGSGPSGSVQTYPTFVFQRRIAAPEGNLGDGDSPPQQVECSFVGPPTPPKGQTPSFIWGACGMQRFGPAVSGKNVMCMCPVPQNEGTLHPLDNEQMHPREKRYICGWMGAWKDGTYTSNLMKHYRHKHFAEFNAGQKTSNRTQAYKQEKMKGLQTVTGGMAPGAEFTPERRKKLREIKVLWCSWNLRPPNMLADEGFRLVSSFLNAKAPMTKISHESFSTLLAKLCFEEMDRIKKLIAGVFQTFPRAVGPVFSGQLDGWTAKDNTAFWAFSVSWMDDKFCRQRVGIAFSQFPGRHTAERVVDWIKDVTKDFFGGKKPRQVFVALTTDGGSNLGDLESRLKLYRHQCSGHLLNTIVSWSVGKAGTKDTENVYEGGNLVSAATVGTCEHKEILPLFKAVKTVVRHFQKSSLAGDELEAIQRNFEVEDPDGYSEALKALKPVLANDTRWTSNFDMLVRMMRMQKPIQHCLQHDEKALRSDQWITISHLIGVLFYANELARRLQGGEGSFISTAYKMKANFKKATAHNEFLVPTGLSSDPDEIFDYTPVPVGIPAEYAGNGDTLHPRAARCREILLARMEKYKFCKVTHATPMMCIMLNPATQRLHAQFAGEGEDGWVYNLDMDGELLLRKEYEQVWKEQNPQFQHQSGFIWHGTSYWDSQSDATKQHPNGGMDPTKVRSNNLESHPHGAGAAAARPAPKRKTLDDWDPPMRTSASQNDKARCEVTRYLEVDDDCKDVNQFWKDRAGEFPILAVLARKYHSIDSTSCEPERVFSRAGFLLNAYRRRMSAHKVEQFMLLNMNKNHHPMYKPFLKKE